jgi:hypothetical protein
MGQSFSEDDVRVIYENFDIVFIEIYRIWFESDFLEM